MPDGGSGWVPGPPDTSRCISTFLPLLLRIVLWGREMCPETLVALGPQAALPSGRWLGENLLLPIRLLLGALVPVSLVGTFCILASQAGQKNIR